MKSMRLTNSVTKMLRCGGSLIFILSHPCNLSMYFLSCSDVFLYFSTFISIVIKAATHPPFLYLLYHRRKGAEHLYKITNFIQRYIWIPSRAYKK